MERVADADKSDWLAEKQNGPGRDERVAPIERGSGGARVTSLKDIMAVFRPWTAPPADWPFRGPSAVME
eukprot:4967774-Lingulodinium_polyedra.AAC.1